MFQNPANVRKALILIGCVGLAFFHLSSQNYPAALTDVLTVLAATHAGPILDILTSLGLHIPADPTAGIVETVPGVGAVPVVATVPASVPAAEADPTALPDHPAPSAPVV